MNYYEFLLAILIAFFASLIFTPITIRVCHKYALFDLPARHKRHQRPVPNLGGSVIFAAIWISLFIFIQWRPDELAVMHEALPYIFAGSLLIYLIGLIDDLKPVSAWAKLMVQVIVGLILYYGGLTHELISLPILGSTAINGFSVFITVFWVVALTNAINLIDGLDGLASGVSVIAALSMTVIGILYSSAEVILLSLAIVGILSAFLIFNRHPARIFLGDSGSLLIGYFFAVISLVVPFKSFTTAALFLPLVILGVPLTEAVSSFIRRLAAGKSVLKADRRHIFHYLAYAGLSPRQIVYLFYLSGVFFGAISIAMSLYYRVLVWTILILFMVVIFIIYLIFIGRMKKKSTIS